MKLNNGLHIKTILGTHRYFCGLTFVYWGKSQSHKFRRFSDHIDLGVISVYNLPQKGIGKYFWKFVAWSIKPLRKRYHKKYVYKDNNKIENIIDFYKS